MRRLDQLLANLGYCSRREAGRFLRRHDVCIGVDAQPAREPATKVDAASVMIDGEPLDHPDGLLLLLHKPTGLVCSHEAREGPSIYDLLPERWRARNPIVTSIGRLDKETSGLILLTDQTQLVHRWTSPKHKVPKIYQATLDQELANADELAELFAAGTLTLEGEKTTCAPAFLRKTGSKSAELTLIEGRYHQVRRMFASQGYHVTTLHRSHFGNLKLGAIPPSSWSILPLDTSIETPRPNG